MPEDLNWAALTDPDATPPSIWASRTFPALVAKLIEHGLPPDTPALFAESIGHADQRFVRTTIARLAEQLQQENVTATAIILFGSLATE